MHQPSSNIFEGYRSVGNVTGPLPFIVRHGRNPKDTRIITVVGKSFHTYTPNLSLVEVSIPHEYEIRAILADERHIFTASGRSVLIWARGGKNLIQRLDNGHNAPVRLIFKLDKEIVASVDDDNVLLCWNSQTKEILNIISFEEGVFKISAACHPMNYKDKLLLGSSQGQLELWNLANEKKLYKFMGWETPVSSLVQSPQEDVIAIGLEDGHVYIHNIRYDETVMKIYQEYGVVTSMSFRLDGLPYLVTTSAIGHLMVWNLEKKRLSAQIRDAHVGFISKCQFFRNEALLVTAGSDNSLKIWSMDQSDGGGNLLCQRAGHSEPPTHIKFYGSKGFNLLSAGRDSTVKMFHMYSERLNRNLGTARWNPKSKNRGHATINKLPPITQFDAETTKEKSWDNIAACHENSSLVTTWNYDKCKMGKHFIRQPTFDKHSAHSSSVCLSPCGNFVTIGFTNGYIFKYNMQSGIFRQTYESSEVSEQRAHDGAITGLAIDGLNIVLISSGTDSTLRVWNFKSGLLLMTKKQKAPIVKITLHKETNLLAMAMDNNLIEVMDLETRETIREFQSKHKILDMTLSPDSRWLIVSCEDNSIRTWDLHIGKLIDAFRLSSPCVSLSLSSTGEFLATAHRDMLGIYIWCNYTIYCPSTLKSIDENAEPVMLDLPFVRTDEPLLEDQESDELILANVQADKTDLNEYISPDQLDKDLITLSGLPSSRWKNLLILDEIRERQRIMEEEGREKLIKVPFFIPVKEGLKPRIDDEAIRRDMVKEKPVEPKPNSLDSPLVQCLISCANEGKYQKFIDELKLLGPSATSVELSLMDDSGGESCHLAKYFLDAMSDINIDFELKSSWLALFLKIHADRIEKSSELRHKCLEVLESFKSQWGRLRLELDQIFSVLNFCRSSIL